jgi:ATP-dependent RNA helicase DeaD
MLPSNFESLGINESILKAVKQLGYEQPSPIQLQSIPILLDGENLLGVAQTGTGKTGAFAMPLLSRLEKNKKKPQILVLTPTRELAIQVAEAFQTYARNINKFHVLPIYGGQDISTQLRGLRRGAQVIVGTPGRILDHIRRQSLILNELNALVLDEADEMLRMGFIDDVETILAQTPSECQRALFSATMPPAIRRVIKKYLGNAKEVSIASKTKTVERITQFYLIVKGHQKMEALTRILEVEKFDGMLIFVRTKSATTEVTEKLEARGFSASALNGDLSQTIRERTVNKLKKGQIDIVVATDVAARGLDVERISHVINYDIPYDNEAYVHRIGRTGRAGRDGKAILFVAPKESRLLHSIEKSTKQRITMMNLPTGDQVSGQRIQQFKDKILQSIEVDNLDQFKELLHKLCENNSLSISDVAAGLASQVQQDRPLFPNMETMDTKFYERKSDGKMAKSNSSSRRRKSNSSKKNNQEDSLNMVTYRMEAGKNDGVMPKDIVGAIASESGIDGKNIGRIALFDNYSTVDLPEGMPNDIFQHLKHKVRVKQRPMKLSILVKDIKNSQFIERKKPRKTSKKSKI